ncbi:MAG: hypothetical protein E6J37_06430 [Chloroflexi bacterium]|nr:MAG: hypothetical protein E6J37_06430 [Chloroflexota bacterium]
MKRSEKLARFLGAGLGVVGGFALGYFMVGGVGHPHPGFIIIGLTTLEGLIFAYLATPYVLGGWRTFNFRLTSTPLPDLLSGLLGMVVGLVIAALIGVFVRDLPRSWPCCWPPRVRPSASHAEASWPLSFSAAALRRRATA